LEVNIIIHNFIIFFYKIFIYLLITSSKQRDLYEETFYNLVESVLSGFNGTIFAYGQTGTGKTFTISGVPKDHDLKGIMPRTFETIFKSIECDTKK